MSPCVCTWGDEAGVVKETRAAGMLSCGAVWVTVKFTLTIWGVFPAHGDPAAHVATTVAEYGVVEAARPSAGMAKPTVMTPGVTPPPLTCSQLVPAGMIEVV